MEEEKEVGGHAFVAEILGIEHHLRRVVPMTTVADEYRWNPLSGVLSFLSWFVGGNWCPTKLVVSNAIGLEVDG